VFDACLIRIWYGTAWVADTASQSLATHEFCAAACKWITSGSVLLLVLIFIAQDIYAAGWHAWRETRQLLAASAPSEDK